MKKGQSAIEFLITYGWAFLIILVIMGLLVYFGVFDASRYLPDRCIFKTGVGCAESFIDVSNQQIRANVVNGIGKTIVLQTFADTNDVFDNIQGVEDCDTPTVEVVDDGATVDLGSATATWSSGETIELRITCTTFTEDAYITADIALPYQEAGSSFTKTITGSISGRAQ